MGTSNSTKARTNAKKRDRRRIKNDRIIAASAAKKAKKA
jgi:hypothetical protein